MKRTICASALLLACWTASHVAAEGPVGWRNDGTGRFPDATPPAEWASNKNVVWKATMPGASYGAPIVVGEYLFVVSDPAEVLCLRRSSGEVVWSKSNKDIEAPAAARGGFGPGGPGGPGGWGGGPGGRGRPDENQMNQMRKDRLDGSTPDDRAMGQAFREMMNQRMTQRGVGGGFGGGFGGRGPGR